MVRIFREVGVKGLQCRTATDSALDLFSSNPSTPSMSLIRIAPLFALVLAGCSNTQPEQEIYQPDLAHGELVYKGQCGSCHDAGKRSAPALSDAEDWDLQSLSAPGIIRQHLAANLIKRQANQGPLSEYDEADVLFYMKSEVGEGESRY